MPLPLISAQLSRNTKKTSNTKMSKHMTATGKKSGQAKKPNDKNPFKPFTKKKGKK